ncbi:MAG: IMP cyclohydrolase [Clostridia bacterium]|nr:IMP cyclohydrolase [Clostridia bacterium]
MTFNTYELLTVKERLAPNPYPGRGIILGKTPDGKHAVFAYFIMGRSENSRNRIFTESPDGSIRTEPYDASKVKDPSLIIYAPVRPVGNHVVVTNGDQTDTIVEGMEKGLSFSEALTAREFEPDAPNLTPRISGILNFNDAALTYDMSILKSADAEGSACNRFTYSYASLPGVGHFIHTYMCDGNPLPTFSGEPERTVIPNDIDEFANEIWNSLNEENKISLAVRFYDIADGGKTVTSRLFNKYTK